MVISLAPDTTDQLPSSSSKISSFSLFIRSSVNVQTTTILVGSSDILVAFTNEWKKTAGKHLNVISFYCIVLIISRMTDARTFKAGVSHRCKSPFFLKRVWWTIILPLFKMSNSILSLQKKTNSQCRYAEKEPIVWNVLKACNRQKIFCHLKELLRIYKLSLLLKEYADPPILLQKSRSLSFAKFLRQFLFQKNDLKILTVLTCDASL